MSDANCPVDIIPFAPQYCSRGVLVRVTLLLSPYNHTAEGDDLGPTLSMRGIDNAAYYRLTGDGGTVAELATRLSGSSDLYQRPVSNPAQA
jgi:pullulanase/glycogen debranching enzyme